MCTLTWPCAPLQVPPSPQQEPTHCTRSRCVWHGRFCDMEIHGPLLMPRVRASRQAASSTASTHRASARRRRSAGAVPDSTGRVAGRPRAPRPLPRRRRRGAALLLLTPLLLLLLDFSLLALSLDALLAALHVAEPAPDASPLRFGSDGRPAGRSGAGQRAVCCVVLHGPLRWCVYSTVQCCAAIENRLFIIQSFICLTVVNVLSLVYHAL